MVEGDKLEAAGPLGAADALSLLLSLGYRNFYGYLLISWNCFGYVIRWRRLWRGLCCAAGAGRRGGSRCGGVGCRW